jgi:hypothetical protein
MYRYIFCVLFLSLSLFAKVVTVGESHHAISILQSSETYIDTTKSLSLEDIKQKKFTPSSKKNLSYGYSPDYDVWVKFTLKNSTNKKVSKLLHYKNPLSTHIDFYDGNSVYKDGLFQRSSRVTLTPTFQIELEANESKTYYLKTHAYITPLIIKLELVNNEKFQKSEMIHQVILALFFGAMLVLTIYNFFIFIFTKEVSYFYYVLYILGVILHQLSYTGSGYVYLLNQQLTYEAFEYLAIIVGFPAFALALFTKSFLQIDKYKILCNILDILVILLVVSMVVIVIFDLDKYRSIVPLVLTLYLFFITLWSAIKRNKQAYFILFGWSVLIVAIVLLYLSSMGKFDIFNRFPYIVEVAFLSEAIIFSIALAYRIRVLEGKKIRRINF